MKKIFHLPIALLLLIAASCSTQNKSAEESLSGTTDSTGVKRGIYATMSISDTIRMGDSVMLKFTVYNPTDSAQKFLKWQTPFEPLLSKYLDIKDDKGEEAQYVGAMAKRMMPPPADAYITVAPGDSLIANVNLLKGYALSKAGSYTIAYNSEGVSNLKVDKSLSFIYK